MPLACPACTMKLQGIVDDATRKLMTSKDEADQADKSIDYYADLEKLDGKIERVQVAYTVVVQHLGTVVRKLDSGIHWIIIFSTATERY